MNQAEYYSRRYPGVLGAAAPANDHAALLDMLRPSPGERVLDVGCGLGTLAAALSACGAAVTGIDASPYAISYAREHCPGGQFLVLSATGLQAAFTPATFDAITCVQVLEHIAPGEVEACIRQMAACLRPGGRLLLDVPVTDNLSDRWLILRNWALRGERRPPGAIDSSLDPTHLWRIGDLAGLLARFKAYGLEPESVRRLYYVPWIVERLGWGRLLGCLPARWQEQCLKGATVVFRRGPAGPAAESCQYSALWADPPGATRLARLRKLLA